MPRLTLLSLVLLAILSPLASAQGLLVNENEDLKIRLPRPWIRPTQPAPGTYKIEAIEVDAELSDQVAKVQVTQKFRNTGSQPMEVAFVFPLPYDAAVEQLTLLVDGKEFAGQMLPADEARATYEAIVRRNEDPALLEWVGHGLFRTSVFPVPAGAERTVTLRYSQLCKQSQGLTDFTFPLSTAKYTSEPVDLLSLRMTIESQTPISNLYSPSHTLKVERPNDRRAVVTYEAKNTLPARDFRLLLDTTGTELGANLVSYRPNNDEPGYFLLLASPKLPEPEDKPGAKTVLFVVDRSGSMSGEKIEQAKGALRFVLNNMREGDTFNIVAYDTKVESFRPELQKVSDESRAAALAYVDSLYAGGSTNIDGALKRAFSMLDDSSRPTYVIFLTDGLPTAGEQTEAGIVANTKSANKVRARLFTFGVGYDVNSRLLDKLCQANYGQGEFVRPDENIEASVARLYNRIGSPVLTDVALSIDVDDDDSASSGISGVYPQGVFDLFAGEQVVLVGRYSRHGSAKITLSGALAGEQKSYDFPANLVSESPDETNAFIGRLWATRRVGEIIDQIDLNGKNQELIDELVGLATKHGIVTQYTSFLADETADHNDIAGNRNDAFAATDALAGNTTNSSGFNQRWHKGALKKAAAPQAAPEPSEESALDTLRRTAGNDLQAAQAYAALAKGMAGGNACFYDADGNTTRMANNIRLIGCKTFFLRKVDDVQLWCDSSVDEEAEQNAEQIERFSDEYFALIEQHGSQVAPYLAIDEPVIVRLGDVVYRW